MPTYRLYRLDGAGKITSAEWIEAATDNEAVADAQQRANAGRFELWERKRLVGNFVGNAD